MIPWAIIFSVVRSVAPPILAYAAGRWPQFAGPITELSALIVTGGAATWGAMTHTTAAQLGAIADMRPADRRTAFQQIPDGLKLAAVEAMPDVVQVKVKANATDGVADAAADPTRPKVVKL